MNEHDLFGPVCASRNVQELVSVHRHVIGEEAQAAVAAFGMILASRAAPPGRYREDALGVLNSLGHAKLALDQSICHTAPTVLVTAAILAAAQKFVDDATIPCTEWPSSEEVVRFVFEFAAKYAYGGPWKRCRLGPNGVVVGVEEFLRL